MSIHIYLRKANDNLVSHCKCPRANALISSPSQMDCPWCGCGWLFICSNCGKTFTFAQAFEIAEPIEDIARRAIYSMFHRPPTSTEVEEWIESMTIFLEDLVIGEHYVYLDGCVISTTDDKVHFDGWHSRHDLEFVPQLAALRDTRITTNLLTSPDYWRTTAIPDEDN